LKYMYKYHRTWCKSTSKPRELQVDKLKALRLDAQKTSQESDSLDEKDVVFGMMSEGKKLPLLF